MNDLTIVCVTAWEAHSLRFIDRMELLAERLNAEFLEFDGVGANYIEAVLDDAIAECDTEYILRLDDDEACTPAMEDWLQDRHYRSRSHWCFPRMNLWPDEHSYIASSPLWPDLQTRLSVKDKAGGRHQIHVGSPYGTGEAAPCAIEHHKFLVRPKEDRAALLDRYEQIQPGAGERFRAFSLPEEFPNLRLEHRQVPA